MTSTDEKSDRAPATTDRSWVRLLAVLAAVMVGWVVVVTVMSGEIIPPVLVFGVLYLAGSFVIRAKPDKAGPIYLLVVSATFTLVGGPFAIDAIPHPESAIDFIFSVVQLAVPLAIIAASVGLLRHWAPRSRLIIGYGLAGIVAVLSAVSIIAALSLEDDLASEGDIRFAAEDVEFTPDTLAAGAGTLGVFIDNEDPIRHTFVIEQLDVKLELPANTARRVEFEAAPGTYDFICDVPGHEDMVGVLTVTG